MSKETTTFSMVLVAIIAVNQAAFSATTDLAVSSLGPALTIYNENFAVVRDQVPLNLVVGQNQVSFTDITSKLEPDSVILRDPTGQRSLAILEQNYRGDTVTQGMLLYLNEGKTIDFEVPGTNGGPPTFIKGKIIRSGYTPEQQNPYGYYQSYSQSDNSPLIEVNGELQFGLPGTPLFPELSDDSILEPTLQWTILAEKAGPLNAELAYITDGITWNAAYNIVEPNVGSNLGLTAWVTIDNECGKEFGNARIKLMAGDVNKVRPNSFYGQQFASDSLALTNPAVGGGILASQKNLDEYHLYTLPNATTLRNHETKQVQFLHVEGVPSKEIYVYDGCQPEQEYSNWQYYQIRSQSDYGTTSTSKVAIEREFVNSKANGIGVPLPAGLIRFYREDSDGQLEFVGENTIDHTPQDETVKVITGNAFDIVGSRTQSNYVLDNQNNRLDESFLITLKNHKSTPISVDVVEHLYREKTWTITTSSDPYVKNDSSTITFTVAIPPGGEKDVTYSAHYTW